MNITINFDMDGTKEKWIWLDCDGTWIDLYGVQGWREMLNNSDPTPYATAKPLVNLTWLARTIHELQAKNVKVGIISWLSKNGNEDYNQLVTKTKLNYFQRKIPSVKFDAIHIVPYGTPKSSCGQGILFDDEEKNRKEWKGISFDETDLIKKMRKILNTLG